ncbi:hypothetical protein DFP94_101476 [Fontibacillus phaseoli]|uniref:Uncharacterized protein n=1 Tax=Fontibacillus phaseoli TaxID=1416533 RepID=A0A369BR00_9BACL|nr:hypothetical protein [Fontibacillus phaseoli]RCX22887.1 hypothetical protein DFP94_101476 [Fontibacillus phaseoli]
MSNVKLTKFPVTAPDGTEYRVKIRECEDGMWVSNYAIARLYAKRKRWGFRKVFGREYLDGGGAYSHGDPDYITIASRVVGDYYAALRADAEYRRMISRDEVRRQSAAERFAQWDGRITD